MVDKLLVPLEPRAVLHKPYVPGDCPISREQLAQHTYIEQQRDEAIRMFLQNPQPPEITHVQDQQLTVADMLTIVCIGCLLAAGGYLFIVSVHWIGELIGL